LHLHSTHQVRHNCRVVSKERAFLNLKKVQTGQTVLINGAAGGVGTFAVQIAKSLGACVTGVCSARNVELLRSIGADEVIDYGHEDFARSAQYYDLLLDLVGNRSLSDCLRAVHPRGTYISCGGRPEHLESTRGNASKRSSVGLYQQENARSARQNQSRGFGNPLQSSPCGDKDLAPAPPLHVHPSRPRWPDE
jgi:NADPH:quinone reductase-like Zn-dependent oxidoreductase